MNATLPNMKPSAIAQSGGPFLESALHTMRRAKTDWR